MENAKTLGHVDKYQSSDSGPYLQAQGREETEREIATLRTSIIQICAGMSEILNQLAELRSRLNKVSNH